jgi:bacteriorhodopsin
MSLFTVPPHTPLWLWASVSVLCLSVFNFFLIRRLLRGTGERRAYRTTAVVIWMGFVLLVFDLIFRYWRR